MRRRVCPQECHAPEAGVADRAEGRAEGAAVAEVGGEVRDVGLRAVEAADEAAAEVEISWAEEPVACGDDDIVKEGDLRGPVAVGFIEVEVVRALLVVGVGFLGID